jgi:hypothetical protein
VFFSQKNQPAVLSASQISPSEQAKRRCEDSTTEPFGYADKSVEKHCQLICRERKILFRLKKNKLKRQIISRMNMATLAVCFVA